MFTCNSKLQLIKCMKRATEIMQEEERHRQIPLYHIDNTTRPIIFNH